MRRTDNTNRFPSKFSIVSTLPSLRLVFNSSVSSVCNVVSKIEMKWINTQFIVPRGAIVKYVLSFFDGSNAQNPSRYVCSKRSGVPSWIDASVPRSVNTRNPYPTTIFSDSYSRPKTSWKCVGKSLRSQVLGRNVDHSSFSAPYGLLALRSVFIMRDNERLSSVIL